MQITITAIKFNHSADKCASALNIRKNFGTRIPVPEWTIENNANAKAAYSISDTLGTVISVQAKFLSDAAPNTQIKIRTQGGGDMGNVAETDITLPNDDYITLPLTANEFNNIGINIRDISWTWQYKIADGDWQDLGTTNFRIYTLLSAPTFGPWVSLADLYNTQLPWTDVLDFACVWAAGLNDIDEIQKAITEAVYNLGERNPALIAYDTIRGDNNYTIYDTFQCTKFLERLNGGVGNGQKVNCTDCAVIVSSFANILGCYLWQSRMGYNFELRSLRAIGTNIWNVPFAGTFYYHEVAWKDVCTENTNLYDACLQLNSNTGAGAPVPLLPVNIKFGACANPAEYRALLTTATPTGCPLCIAQPLTRKKRQVA